MARKLVSYEDVAELCNSFVAAGEEPSTVKVHKQLGRGSYSTITKLIKQWRDTDGKEAQANQLPAVVELPASFSEEANLFLKKIFHLAEAEHAAAIERNNTEKEIAIAQAQAEAQEAIDISDETSTLNDELTARISDIEAQLTESNKKNICLTRDIEDQQKEYDQLESDYSSLEESAKQLTDVNIENQSEIKSLKLQLDAVIVEHGKDIATITEQHASDIQSQKALHEKDIEIKDKEIASLQKAEDQHNSLITEKDNAIKSLQDQNHSLITEKDNAIKSLQDQHNSLLAEKDKVVASLQAQIELLSKQNPDTNTNQSQSGRKRTTSKK
ncbi:TPA: DNA-binding protein [Photobacterium damselae]